MATVLRFPHVQTKLCIPALRQGLVSRPALSRKLSRCAERRLLLVSAPAGSGKTTLLSQWAQQSSWPVAWVSLDAADNDPVRFWSYLAAALDGLEPSIGQNLLPLIHQSKPELGDYMIAMLINLIALIPDPFALILDDYHCIETEAIHAGLTELLDHLPPTMHLILSSRADPPLPLARWRAQGHLMELRTPNLRFSLAETEALFNQALELRLSSERIAGFQSWLEGWPAGLQLAALTIAERQAQQVPIPRPGLQEDGRYISEFLASEVLEQQPQPLRAFLLQTSILDTLSEPLCDAVTGRAGSRTTLEEVYRRNLFVEALGRKGHYRYHRLFADLLREQLQQDPAYDPPALHMRAATWYQAHGQPDQAVGHALAAGRIDEACRIIKEVVRSLLLRGEAATIRAWFAALTDETIRSEPLFCLAFAWVRVNAGQVEAALPYLDHLEATLPGGGEANLLLGEAAAVRARAAVMQGDVAANIRHSERALALLPAEAALLRSEVFLDLAFAHKDNWSVDAAEAAFREAIRLGRAAGNLRAALVAAYYLADTYLALGRQPEAAQLYHQMLDWCRQGEGRPPLALACWAHAGLGALLYEWNDLADALDHLQQAVALGRQSGEIKVLVYARLTLAHLLQTQGRQGEADATLEEGSRVAGQMRVASVSSLVDLARVRLWVRQGKADLAAAWLQRHGLSIRNEALAPHELTMLAWTCLAQGRANPPASQAELGRLLELVEARCRAEAAAGQALPHLNDRIILALTLSALGRPDRAVVEMARTVSLAEPSGLVRTFVDCAPLGAGGLLRRVAAQQPASGYLHGLLAALDDGRPAAETPGGPGHARNDEPPAELNWREVEVLRHLAEGHSNQEIADEMILALSTIKWYLRTIYSKLGVNRRTQAVARARALGILTPH